MTSGRIISLSSWSMMWQCQTGRKLGWRPAHDEARDHARRNDEGVLPTRLVWGWRSHGTLEIRRYVRVTAVLAGGKRVVRGPVIERRAELRLVRAGRERRRVSPVVQVRVYRLPVDELKHKEMQA